MGAAEFIGSHLVEYLVHISSREDYGAAREEPIIEAYSWLRPCPYLATKLRADNMTLSYDAFALAGVIARPPDLSRAFVWFRSSESFGLCGGGRYHV